MEQDQDERLVFVPNKGTHDFSPAEHYGRLVYITDGQLSRFDTNMILQACEDVLEQAREDDFLLVTSLNIINCIASAVLAARFGRVNYLLFNRGKYLVRTVKLGR